MHYLCSTITDQRHPETVSLSAMLTQRKGNGREHHQRTASGGERPDGSCVQGQMGLDPSSCTNRLLKVHLNLRLMSFLLVVMDLTK